MANILVVDDERNVRVLIKRILEEQGHHVLTVATGEEALVELKKNSYDLLILDLKLPGISGVELLKRMTNEGLSLPTLIVSAITNAAPIVEAMKYGACDYLSKPFPSQDLIKKVDELLRKDEITYEKLVRRIEEKLSHGRYDVAEKMARNLFAIHPSAESHYIYAMVLKKMGNDELAYKHLKAALALDPNHKKALEEISSYEQEN
ncbi:response regulator [Pseudothermotoga thermarum]|uniref:Response regulator receiver protein n=1 Tax=Pseudothermotoga thermarum DSM 5069 TaxID=688269 RepID=F7YW21_9THEM|nr:response regulator [Pseudothermotoga thermarum]AEH50508.1 response regulator receiver protein [Pseudothermotoga thermarum DSM 5069]